MATASRWARLRTVLGWPAGIALVSWRYMWRTIPLHRSEEAGDSQDLPDQVDDDGGDGRQGLAAGAGPMLHRSYAVRIVNTALSPAALIDMVADRLNQASPEMAVFRKTRGADGPLRPGDELLVRMPGPWDGPVRVIHRDATCFRLATLDGHLEAGEIEFRASPADGAVRFEIESWARAGDRLADLLYNKLRLAKEIQLNMWSHFCIRTAALAGGRPQGGVTIRTRWVAWPPDSENAMSSRSLTTLRRPSEQALLGIYLNDHLAGTTGIVELARRAAASQRGTETGEVLQQLAAELTAGRAALRTMMATLGVPERQYKTWAAWLAEKAGRLKLNGSLLERSPLSSVLELEMLRLGMEATGAAWHTLSELAERDERLNKTQLTDLLARAKQQSQTLEELRIRAASRAFSGPTGQ
jgi:hypothetical protein